MSLHAQTSTVNECLGWMDRIAILSVNNVILCIM